MIITIMMTMVIMVMDMVTMVTMIIRALLKAKVITGKHQMG